jgi:hypothetical protein
MSSCVVQAEESVIPLSFRHFFLKRVMVNPVWRILRLRADEKTLRYGGQMQIYWIGSSRYSQ